MLCSGLQGTYIIPLLASVLRDRSQWEKPDLFYPEHFLDSKGKFMKKEAFMPFSAGTTHIFLRASRGNGLLRLLSHWTGLLDSLLDSLCSLFLSLDLVVAIKEARIINYVVALFPEAPLKLSTKQLHMGV